MSKEKYYLLDKEDDDDFIELDTVKDVEDHILSLTKEVSDVDLEQLKSDITIIKGKKMNFTGRLVIDRISVQDIE